MTEGNAGEVAGPHDAGDDAAEGGGDEVAQGLPQVEALEGELPAAVDGAELLGFSNQLFPGNLYI